MPQIGSSSRVTHSSCDQASRASESIPSRRHRARTPPTEQSIGSPCCTSLLRGSWTGLYNGRLNLFTTQHDRSGEVGCLITLDHFEPLDLYSVRGQPPAPPHLSQYLSELCSLDQPNHSFEAYAVSIEETKSHSEEHCSGLMGKNGYDP
jgi:hypothetical protein